MQEGFKDWMLPEGVVEALPQDALVINQIEQQAISTFSSWGYQLLRTPLVEYANTFTKNAMNDYLSNQTIQFKDQKSGRQLGFRSDFTPQISRIDAHYLKTEGIARYSYAGEVARSYPDGYERLRNPSIVGVELIGSEMISADIEVVTLLIDYLKAIGLKGFTLSLGHIEVIAVILKQLGIDEPYYATVFDLLAKKDKEGLSNLIDTFNLSDFKQQKLMLISDMYGDTSVIDEVKKVFLDTPEVSAAINEFEQIVIAIQSIHQDVDYHIDFADIHGYGYHNGLIFSIHHPSVWQAIARGGRYDSVGSNFSDNLNTRPSIGFSCHLNLISGLITQTDKQHNQKIIRCDFDISQNQSLFEWIKQLRAHHQVICALNGEYPKSVIFTDEVIKQGEDYMLRTL